MKSILRLIPIVAQKTVARCYSGASKALTYKTISNEATVICPRTFSSLLEKLNDWTASIVSKDESGSQLSIPLSHLKSRWRGYRKSTCQVEGIQEKPISVYCQVF
ncbi:unnamed protein product [Camellia sinensis]